MVEPGEVTADTLLSDSAYALKKASASFRVAAVRSSSGAPASGMLSGSAARTSGTNVGGPLATTRERGPGDRDGQSLPGDRAGRPVRALLDKRMNLHAYVDHRGDSVGVGLDLTRVRDVGGLLAATVPPRAAVQAGGQVETDLGRTGVRRCPRPRSGTKRRTGSRPRPGLVGREAALPADNRLRCPVRADPGANAADRSQQQYDDHQAAEESPGPGGERRLGLGRPRRLPGLEHIPGRTGARRAHRAAIAVSNVRVDGVPDCSGERAPDGSGGRAAGRRGGAITPPAGGGVCGAEYCAATPCAWRGVGDTGPSGWAHHSGAVLCGRLFARLLRTPLVRPVLTFWRQIQQRSPPTHRLPAPQTAVTRTVAGRIRQATVHRET